MFKAYTGTRLEFGFHRVDVQVYDDSWPAGRPLAHIRHHSDGFEWGYGGSGPADLALAILANYFDESADKVKAALQSMWTPRSKAAGLHLEFKAAFVAGFAKDKWRLDSPSIDEWLNTPIAVQRLAELADQDAAGAYLRRLEEEGESDVHA